MKRVLVINPNTSAGVTDHVGAACRAAQPGLAWEGVTARFGMRYIADEISYAIAGHAVLDAFAAFYGGHDAVLIACFGDPGLLALCERSPVPVVGLAQASFRAAGARGRFAVVTGGARWGPMLERFARSHALDTGLVAVRTIALTGAQIAHDPQAALDALAQACQATVDAGARQVVLGGAALAGLAARLQPRLQVPVLDNVELGAQAVADALASPAPWQAPGMVPNEAVGLSPELGQLLR